MRALEGIAWGALLVAAVVSRAAVAPDVLFDWDSANYALGIRDFDVYEHQPHPPGYPVFIALLKALAWLPGPETTPFVVANLLFTVAILAMLGWMARREAGPAAAWVMALAFAVCPVFWFQGSVAAAYVAECFSSVLVAATALALCRGRIPTWVAGAALGLAIGVRPNGVVTLAPVALLALWQVRPGLRDVVAWVGAFGAVCVTWFVPLMAFGGGVARYRLASAALFHWQLEAGSLLAGDTDAAAENSIQLAFYLLDAINVLVLVGAPMLVLAVVRGRIHGASVRLFAAWLLPGFAVYGLHHLPKSGYVLTLVPGLFLGIALALPAATGALRPVVRRVLVGGAAVGVAGYVALNTWAFLVAVPAALFDEEDAPIPIGEGLLITGDYGRIGLLYRTWPQRKVKEIVDGMDPERDLGVFPYGAGELYRLETWYHPEHWLIATSVVHGSAFSLVSDPPGSFGDYQVALLQSDENDWSWPQRTLVGLDGTELTLFREGHALRVPLGRVPRRVVVFVPCPPCDVVATRGLEPGPILDVGAGYTAREMIPLRGDDR